MDITSIGGSNLAPTRAQAQAEESRNPAVNAGEASRAASSGQEAGQAGLQRAVSQLQEYVQSTHRDLRFELDESTGQVVVQVYAGHSGELIRQIPSEEALRLSEQLEEMRSLLFEAKA
ncbi:flagellar protein FlaG [Stutzerimonas azotifigens]|uniref:flagellar protein FlaG n=1 Tax=Stutzerimonas azotifigens TaxID=291995 RepID=UPI0003F7A1E3|nr:flagellar protein FlaG [Stutzerimonas azotifigens]